VRPVKWRAPCRSFTVELLSRWTLTPAGGRELSNEKQAWDQMADIIRSLMHERS